MDPGHAADRAVRRGLGGAGGRAGAAVAPARRRARRPLRVAQPAHRGRPATGAAVRPSRLRARRQRHRSARAPPAFHARLRRQPVAGRHLPGQRRLDAGAVGRRLRAGRPARSRALGSRSLRTDRAATDDAVRPGAAAGADRRRTRRRAGSGGGGAQPGHLLRNRLRPGVSGHAAGFSDGGERGLGGARGQVVDALAGHLETGRRRPSPGRRRLHRPARSARRLPARRGRSRGGVPPRDGDHGQHPGQWHPGKPWAASVFARAVRAPALRGPATADRAGVLGRHRRRTLTPAGEPLVAAGEVHRGRQNPCRADPFVLSAGAIVRPYREDAVAMDRPGAAAVLVGAHRPCRGAVVGRRRHPVVQRRPAQRVRPDDRRRRLRAGARPGRVHAANRCRQRCLGAPDGARTGRDGEPAVARAAGEDGRGHLGRQLAACAVRPLLDRPLR